MNVNVTNIRNVYNTTVINRGGENRISYNGGTGGLTARPSPAEEAAARGRHLPPIAAQTEHRQQAHGNPELRASANQGKPPIAATEKPASFSGRGVVPAREAGAPYHPPANARETRPAANGAENRPAAAPTHPSEPPQHEVAPRPSPGSPKMEEKKQEERVTNEHPAEAPRPAAPPTHASELPKHQVTAPTSTGNPKVDQRYQQQQEKLVAKQNQQHQKLQQQQEREDQRATQQNYQAQQHQQVEQRHQQQTTHMEQQHTQQTEHLQTQQGGHPGDPPPDQIGIKSGSRDHGIARKTPGRCLARTIGAPPSVVDHSDAAENEHCNICLIRYVIANCGPRCSRNYPGYFFERGR
jgi:hypothetical protein